jgi:DNA-binding NarL/FixJ family response regulator
MRRTRIFVADPVELIYEGLCARLAISADLELVGHASDGITALERIAELQPDLVLLEVTLPGKDGIDTMREIRKRWPGMSVIAHSARLEIEYVNSMRIEGARGFLAKNAPASEIIEAIHTVTAGGEHLSEAARDNIERGYKFTRKRIEGDYIGLTERERDIIRMVAQEKTNEEIAATLFVSPETVKTHRKHLMAKLNVRSAAGLVKYAVDRHWV